MARFDMNGEYTNDPLRQAFAPTEQNRSIGQGGVEGVGRILRLGESLATLVPSRPSQEFPHVLSL